MTLDFWDNKETMADVKNLQFSFVWNLHNAEISGGNIRSSETRQDVKSANIFVCLGDNLSTFYGLVIGSIGMLMSGARHVFLGKLVD